MPALAFCNLYLSQLRVFLFSLLSDPVSLSFLLSAPYVVLHFWFSVSFWLHDHFLPLLYELLFLPLLIFGILSFLTDSLFIIVFYFNTDFSLFLFITLD